MKDNTIGKLRVEQVRDFAEYVLRALDVPADDARYLALLLVDADLRGDQSHGTWRLVILAKRIRAGGIDPRAEMQWVREGRATALLDAANGLGQLAARKAMEHAIKLAKTEGVAIVAVRNSNSFLAAKSATLLAPPRGCIGFVTTTSGPLVAPWGAAKPLLGNGPLAFAFPTMEGEAPVVVDMSMTAAARGRITQVLQAGEQLPPGWALDAEGLPTIDPAAALKGTSAPIGGYKGYGLILVIEILAGLLSGSGWGSEVSLFQPFERPQGVGHLVGAIDVEHFLPLQEFVANLQELAESIRSMTPRPDLDEVRLPGEGGQQSLELGQREGLEYPAYILSELAELAVELKVEPLN